MTWLEMEKKEDDLPKLDPGIFGRSGYTWGDRIQIYWEKFHVVRPE